jgi:hypothetical protein
VYEDYGNLAGFMGFAGAGDASPTPVVRYQDLHRTHSPASAGALAVYENPNASMRQGDFEENLDGYGDVAYGDVAYGEAHAAPPEFAGVQPLPIPTHVAAYAGPSAYAGPTAEDVLTYYSDIKRGSTGSRVKELQDRLVALKYMTQAQVDTGYGTFGSKTEDAVKDFQKRNAISATGVVNTDTWLALYGLSRPSAPATTTPIPASDKKTSRETAERDEGLSAYFRGLYATSGIGASLLSYEQQKKAASNTFAPSGESKDASPGPDWQKIALWSGVAVGGILLTVVIVKAVK